jgi:hypothetical protein
MKKEQLKQYVEASGLVNVKEVGEGIYVLKYKKKVFYDGLWNEYIAECRGTIVDEDFNLITYPFTKIYNYGIEKEAPVLSNDTEVIAFRKVNGFMVACTWYNDDILVSTTGSTNSDYVDMAKEMMLNHMSWDNWQSMFGSGSMCDLTVMFECVHPNDPHIIPEKEGMYLLGYRENEWGSPVGHDVSMLKELSGLSNCYMPEYYHTTVGNLIEQTKNVRHEGFVFYTSDGVSAKIKSPYYLTSKWVARNPRTDKLVDLKNDVKRNLDEEYYPLVDAIRNNIVEYTSMDEQQRLEWVRQFLKVA